MYNIHAWYCVKMSRTIQLRNFIILSTLFILDIDAGDQIFPKTIEVREGEDFQVHFLAALENEVECYVKPPNNDSCYFKLPDGKNNTNCGDKIYYWPINGTCGFYVTNVTKQDNGIWRLTSQNVTGKSIKDIVPVKVLDKFNDTLVENVEVKRGLTYTLSFADVDQYCIVEQPHDAEKIIRNNECNVELKSVTNVDDGDWSAIVGVKGQIEETVKKKNVSVFQEYLDFGYITSSNPEALHLYCNLISENRHLNMCRFSKVDMNQMGLRLYDGSRKGRYGYYGKGLVNGECGLTIQSPEEKDYGRWYCLLIAQHVPRLGATLQVSKPLYETGNASSPVASSNSPVVTTVNETLHLQCSAGVPLSYCRFTQPNGEPVKPDATVYIADNYQDELLLGECTITVQANKTEHNGTWTCYMGPVSLGTELSLQVEVRVADTHLAAVDKYVFTENDTVILQCKTVPHAMALTYCRFYSPSGYGIIVDERITIDNFIQQNDTRYWYSGRGIVVGDCGLVIEHVSSMHNGNWTCAGKLELPKNDEEVIDTIHFTFVHVDSSENTEFFTAGVTTGIVFGAIAIAVLIGALIFVAVRRSRNRSQQDIGN